jgi:hypothetical protein
MVVSCASPYIVRRMKLLLATTLTVFLTTFIAAPTMGAGWFWDTGNGIGFAAFAGLLYLTISSSRRPEIRAHQIFGYAVLFLTLGHAFWFLLGDASMVEFVKFGAPDYMWLGIVSVLLLSILIITAIVPDRIRLHRNFGSFKYWHRILTIAAILSAAYHIAASNFYLHTWYQLLLFAVITVSVCLGRSYFARLGAITIVSPSVYLSVGAASVLLFATIRNLPA